ncbi:transcription factor IIA alpha beta subunit [Boletus reticuloceps]|uniref:Transcription factor IIA alpha beta subunit n=1 Tax=Boletus reticuloceps TaxID=495285 RepID=A0A8I3A8G6_9AGAM|nr:transcription factor IIA alpha beta subunit [Boletus reticuloceps]
MSNKIVPSIYRAVIDEVIAAIKPEFDEYGVNEDVLADLQHKWQSKVVASHVAEFEPQPQQTAQHHPVYPPHPMHMIPHHPHYPPPHNPYAAPPPQQSTQVKTEPVDSRYILSGPPGMTPYALPPLPGPQLNGLKPPAYTGGQQGVLSFPPHPAHLARPVAIPRPYVPPAPAPAASQPAPASTTPQQPMQSNQATQPAAASQPVTQAARPSAQSIPQVDGPSTSDSESPSPPPSQPYASRPSHPSLPQPPQISSVPQAGDEVINSDLDDSDTEGEEDAEEGAQGDTDIVFCTYDKVGRVKNKWKCILKDGMIHINGKDYLFAKCTGEFEW